MTPKNHQLEGVDKLYSMRRPWLDHTREFEWLTINEHLKRKKTKTKTWNLLNHCRLRIFLLGLNFSTILIHFFNQVKSWQNGRNSDCEQWMSDTSFRANSTRMVMTLDDESQLGKQRNISPITMSCWNFVNATYLQWEDRKRRGLSNVLMDGQRVLRRICSRTFSVRLRPSPSVPVCSPPFYCITFFPTIRSFSVPLCSIRVRVRFPSFPSHPFSLPH